MNSERKIVMITGTGLSLPQSTRDQMDVLRAESEPHPFAEAEAQRVARTLQEKIDRRFEDAHAQKIRRLYGL